MKDKLTTPSRAAYEKAKFFAEVGLADDEVVSMYAGTLIACRAVLELGPDATDEVIIGHTAAQYADDSRLEANVMVAAFEAVNGDFGRIVDTQQYVDACIDMRRDSDSQGITL